MNKQALTREIITATSNLKTAHENHHGATSSLTAAKAQLARMEAQYTLEGLDGKNAEARKAELSHMTTAEQADVENAEQAVADTKLALTLATLEHQQARYLVRIHETDLD